MNGAIRVRKLEAGLWGLTCSGFSPMLVEHAKAVPGMSFRKEIDDVRNVWVGYIDAVTATVARLQFKGLTIFGISDLPNANAWKDGRTIPFACEGRRDYQIEGIKFALMKGHEGCLIADGMRLGKSCVATTAVRAIKKKTLVICPSHVVGVWSRPKDAPEGPGEIAKWWPDAWRNDGVVVLEGVKPFKFQEERKKLLEVLENKKITPVELANAQTRMKAIEVEMAIFAGHIAHAQVIVCHNDIVYAWVEVIRRWAKDGLSLIIDEIHNFAGYQSRRTEAVKELREYADFMLGLTGTPVTNRPQQTANVLELICPGRFGYFFSNDRTGVYSKLYCDAKQEQVGIGENMKTVWNFKGRSNLSEPDGKKALTKEETLAYRLQHMMIRRLKKDVDKELPRKVRKITDVVIPAKFAIGVSSSLLDKGITDLRRVLDLAADGKFKACVKIMEEHANEGEKCIAFCYRRAFCETLANELQKKVGDDTLVRFVHGDMPRTKRDRVIHEIKSHDGPVILCGTIDTISTGLDLSFANVATFCELSHEHADLQQAEERPYAFGAGPSKKILVEYVIARGTGDELILRGIINKLDTAEQTGVAGEDGMKEDLTASRGDPMKRMYAALLEMRKGTGEGEVKSEKKKRRPRQVATAE